MATAKQQIDELSTKVDGLSSVTADVAQDFQAFKNTMEAERENLSAEGQAALDAANAKLDAARAQLADLDVAVGDADGSDTPPVTGGGAGTDPGNGGTDGGVPVQPSPGNEEPGTGGLDGGTPGTTPNPESSQPTDPNDFTPPAGEGTVVSPDAPVDGAGGESDARPTV